MPRTNVGRAMESLVESVVRQTVAGMKHNLPTQKQIERVEERLRELDRRVSRIAHNGCRKAPDNRCRDPGLIDFRFLDRERRLAHHALERPKSPGDLRDDPKRAPLP